MSLGVLLGPAEDRSACGGECEHLLTPQVDHLSLMLHLRSVNHFRGGSPAYSEAHTCWDGLTLHSLFCACTRGFHWVVSVGCRQGLHTVNGYEVLGSGLC